MKTILLVIAGLMTINGASAEGYPNLNTVESVDLTRYAGRWHQIAYLPTIFQKNCTLNTTADYTLRKDGYVTVVNECNKENGTHKTIKGYARVTDAQTNAKLKVKFFWFAPAGDYWIIDLASDYSYAVVGEPSRKYLWILSRSPVMDQATYQSILSKAEQNGFNVKRVQITGTVTAD